MMIMMMMMMLFFRDIANEIMTVSLVKKYAPQLCNVTLGPSAFGQH